MAYYPPEVQITPLTKVRRTRTLPVAGEILVHVGERVEPMQIVARTRLPGEFHVLPVARMLGVSVGQMKRALKVKLDEEVEKGQVIAKRGGLLSNAVHAPMDGVVTAISGGRVLIEGHPTLHEVRAYIPGTVIGVTEPYTVEVETVGAVVQGVWGVGGVLSDESLGVLKCLVKAPDEPLRARSIDPSCHGMILIGGMGFRGAVLERAQELGVRGIVVGGLPPEYLSQVRELPFPLVATEGIGSIPMSDAAFQLLATNDGREAVMSGWSQSRSPVTRPEVVIPLPGEAVPPMKRQPGSPLAVGDLVRVVRAPYIGAVGEVVALPEQARSLDIGGQVFGAEVDIGQDAPVFVPLANLEVLG